MTVGRVDAVRARGNRVVRWGERRVAGHASGRLGSLVLGCLRRFGESSENSASALTLNVFLSFIPALLAVYALADLAHGSGNGIAEHLISHLDLHGSTAALVRQMFGTVASNAAAASLIGLLTFLIFGLPVGQVVQDV